MSLDCLLLMLFLASSFYTLKSDTQETGPKTLKEANRKDRHAIVPLDLARKHNVLGLRRIRRALSPKRRKAALRRKKMEERRALKARLASATPSTTTEEPPWRQNMSRMQKIIDQMCDAWMEGLNESTEEVVLDKKNMTAQLKSLVVLTRDDGKKKEEDMSDPNDYF
uniref:Uncharacterized protein n=1 Tax=Cacopsylla melanoneura TaxID=428564 RepID=A0A8D8Z7Y6_9HEMI